MAEFVEGEWNDFVFKMVKDEDAPKVLELLHRHFFPDETLGLHLCKSKDDFEDLAKDFDAPITAAFKDNLSFYVEHKATGKVAGARIIHLEKRGKQHIPSSPITSFAGKVTMDCLDYMSENPDMFVLNPNLDHYANLMMTATDPEFRGKGLATEMYKRGMKLMKARNIPLCKSVVTSPFTLKACRNLGFDEYEKLYLKEYKDKEGNFPFATAKLETFIVVVSKKL